MLPDHPLGPELSRRTLLRGGAVLAGTAVLGAGLTGTAHAGSYSRIGTGGYAVPTTLRTGFAPYGGGSIGTHSGERAFAYDDWFHLICDSWIETYHSILRWQTAGTVGLWFVGCAGVTVNKPGSNHQTGNAFDLTAVYHSDGGFVDCNYSHHGYAGAVANRQYAALAWSGRKHLPEVGIVGTGAVHANHVHLGRFKNGSASLLLSHWGRSWDAWLVQYTCKAFLGVPIALDGDWGNQTEGYYLELMRRLGLGGRNPFGSVADLQQLAHLLTAYGVVGAAL